MEGLGGVLNRRTSNPHAICASLWKRGSLVDLTVLTVSHYRNVVRETFAGFVPTARHEVSHVQADLRSFLDFFSVVTDRIDHRPY
jgi:hypothetical protein